MKKTPVLTTTITRFADHLFQVNVYADGRFLNFGFIGEENDADGINRVIREVTGWVNTPSRILQSMHSARD
jgi:hypothetical protein